VLNVAIWEKTGLVTFNGPALLTDFAEYPEMFEYTKTYMIKALCNNRAIGSVLPSKLWTEEYLDWMEKRDLVRPRALRQSRGWNWLKGTRAEGTLIGGCLESLDHLRSTPFWPDWHGAIMFIETSEVAPSPERVDSLLMDYENMGVLRNINGLLVGRPMRYTAEEKRRLHEVVLDRTAKYSFPVVADMDFGHTSPQFTLPLGCQALVDIENERFEITSAAVA
jgi:muramoyltetrapeptide carboxypeptidase LdcA involved in peptidoglycan recycling